MGRLSSSTIAAGTFNGMTLFEVLKLHPEYFGNKVQNGTLPILVKFIYAKQDLSIQVHPGDAYAMEHEHRNVIYAEEGPSLLYGFRHRVTEQILKNAVKTDTLGKHL